MLLAYIDDSGDKNQFVLSSLVTDSPHWFYIECAWNAAIRKKNTELTKEGRRTFSRFHASDCSSRKGEFDGWDTKKDQIPFVKELFSIIEKYPINVIAYSIDIRDVAKSFPVAKSNPRAFAHMMLLHYIMRGIVENVLSTNDSPIGIIHDRGSYNGVLSNTFNTLANDPTFDKGKLFTSITPMSSVSSVALQVADLVAFENFKEVDRQKVARIRRKSLDTILLWPQFGGFFKGITEETVKEYAAFLNKISPNIRESLLNAGCVPKEKRVKT
ncbi:MAG: DUF3800 domain-containing protein [Terracidiphilus sp.]